MLMDRSTLHPGEKEWVKEVDSFEKGQAVSVTLENSFNDWYIAQLAGFLEDKMDGELFLHWAFNYRNVFRYAWCSGL